MRSDPGGKPAGLFFFLPAGAGGSTVKTENPGIHAKSSDKKTEVNQFLMQKIFRIT